jgi:hypothetical protein
MMIFIKKKRIVSIPERAGYGAAVLKSGFCKYFNPAH